jgi:hypothetical protein
MVQMATAPLSNIPVVIPTRFRTEAEIRAEQILDAWEDERGMKALLTMNGKSCARHQERLLHGNNFFARTGETEDHFNARFSALQNEIAEEKA